MCEDDICEECGLPNKCVGPPVCEDYCDTCVCYLPTDEEILADDG